MGWKTALKFTIALLVLILLVAGCSQPTELTDEEKAEALRIALSDTRVLEWIGDEEYKVLNIHVHESNQSEGEEFPKSARVQLTKPPDERLPGSILNAYVDLELKKVTRIMTTPRKGLPD